MLNFLGTLSSLLPGYIQGRRQAIADNWQDLQNYNNIQMGQLANAFTEATWQPRMDMMGDAARNSALRTINNGMNTMIHGAYLPGQLMQGNIWSQFIPAQTYQSGLMQLMANQLGMGMMRNNPAEWLKNMQQPNSAANPAPSQIGG